MKDLKILIVGGCGYIGRHLTFELIDNGYKDITIIDNLSNSDSDNLPTEVKFIKHDIREDLPDDKYDVIYHLAAFKSVGESMKEPYLYRSNNIIGTINVINLANKYNSKLIFSSTAAVYDPTIPEIKGTNYILKPLSVYGETKMYCETLIEKYVKSYVIFRYFNVAGYDLKGRVKQLDKDPENLIPKIFNNILIDRPVEIYGDDYDTRDGTCIRDYIHVTDLVRSHVKVLDDKYNNKIYNLGTGSGTTVKEIVDEVYKIMNLPNKSIISNRRPGDMPILTAYPIDDFKTKYGIKEIIESTYQAYKDNYETSKSN